jgi:hypothetical protein
VIPNQYHDIILGLPWLRSENAKLRLKKIKLVILGIASVYAINRRTPSLTSTPISISATSFVRYAKRTPQSCFSITLADIEKALKPKKKIDPSTLLPAHYYEFLLVFSQILADKLPPFRLGIDYKIPLLKDENGKEQ